MSSAGSADDSDGGAYRPDPPAPPVVGSFDALEARLSALKDKMRRGLPQRADEISAAAGRLGQGDPTARDEVRRLAHKLRGIAGSYDFPRLGELSAELEELARGAGPQDAVVARALELAAAARESAMVEVPAGEPSVAASLVAPIVEATPGTVEPVRPRAAAAMPRPAPELEGVVVLAADDDDATRRLLEITLIQLGRMNGKLFDRAPLLLEELASRGDVDLVVVDAMMPDMNGLELLRAVVARGLHLRGTHFVVLSAATAEELGWALPEGLEVGWLRKPFRPKELLTSLVALRAPRG